MCSFTCNKMGALASSIREALVACLLTEGDVERWAEERVRVRLEAVMRAARQEREWRLACC